MSPSGHHQAAEDRLRVEDLPLLESHIPGVARGWLSRVGDDACLLGGVGLSSLRTRSAVAGIAEATPTGGGGTGFHSVPSDQN